MGCVAAALWAHAADTGDGPLMAVAAILWSATALCGLFIVRFLRRERQGLVRQLREAAAEIRPGDVRFEVSVSANAYGAAVDGLIAASRAQMLADQGRIRELELAVRTAGLERDHALATVAQLSEAVRTSLPSAGSARPCPETSRFGELRRRHTPLVRREINRFKRDLLTLVSHRFRTPLASIKAYTEMLIDGEALDTSSQREFYTVIQAEADRLGEAINNVLTVVGVDSGLTRATRQDVRVDAVVADVVRIYQARAAGRGVSLHADTLPEGQVVYADAALISAALGNLLDNAVKFTPTGGTVRLSVEPDEKGRCVWLRVSDTGSGVAEYSACLLEPAIAGNDADGDSDQSAPGLGVAAARRIIEQLHGGKLYIESGPSGGTVASMSLPTRAPNHATNNTSPKEVMS